MTAPREMASKILPTKRRDEAGWRQFSEAVCSFHHCDGSLVNFVLFSNISVMLYVKVSRSTVVRGYKAKVIDCKSASKVFML